MSTVLTNVSATDKTIRTNIYTPVGMSEEMAHTILVDFFETDTQFNIGTYFPVNFIEVALLS